MRVLKPSLTMVDMHERLLERLAWAERDKLDQITSVDVQLHDLVTGADSMVWDADLKRWWLASSRWPMLVRQYIDPTALEAWLNIGEERFADGGRGVAVMRTKVVKPRASGRGTQRRWGSCMLSLSAKVDPRPTITLHSRTCYLGYLSPLDLTVAWRAAELMADRVGLEVEDFQFVWFLEMAQFHGFRSIAYLLGADGPRERFECIARRSDRDTLKRMPGVKNGWDWLRRMEQLDDAGQLYGDMKYNNYLRVRRRFHTEVLGEEYAAQFVGGDNKPNNCRAYPPLPSRSVRTLDFSPLRPDKDVTPEGPDLADFDDGTILFEEVE